MINIDNLIQQIQISDYVKMSDESKVELIAILKRLEENFPLGLNEIDVYTPGGLKL